MKLVRFLMNLRSEQVQIELKNGTILSGKIVNVSPAMNVTLKKVRMLVKDQDPISLENINIRGSNIRHFILPDELPLDTLLANIGPKPRATVPPKRTAKRPARADPRTGREKRMRGA